MPDASVDAAGLCCDPGLCGGAGLYGDAGLCDGGGLYGDAGLYGEAGLCGGAKLWSGLWCGPDACDVPGSCGGGTGISPYAVSRTSTVQSRSTVAPACAGTSSPPHSPGPPNALSTASSSTSAWGSVQTVSAWGSVRTVSA